MIENHSDNAIDELEQMWRRIVFSVLISNTDDHLRNHGFLHQHDTCRPRSTSTRPRVRRHCRGA